ncbi:MAG: hypothetical protein ACOZNI_29475 [Myxococcota bacterium]
MHLLVTLATRVAHTAETCAVPGDAETVAAAIAAGCETIELGADYVTEASPILLQRDLAIVGAGTDGPALPPIGVDAVALTLTDVRFEHATTFVLDTGEGALGALIVEDGTLTVDGLALAVEDGFGLIVIDSVADVRACEARGYSTYAPVVGLTDDGDVDLTLSGCTFEDNGGGTVGVQDGTRRDSRLVVRESTFRGNVGLYDEAVGGTLGADLILQDVDEVTLEDVTFADAFASAWGGSMVAMGSTVTITGGAYTGNAAGECASILLANGGSLVVDGTTFEGGEAESGGGEVCAAGASVTLRNVTSTGAKAAYGGFLWLSSGAEGTLEDSVVTGITTGYGVLLGYQAGGLTVTRSRLCENVATSTGGAIWVEQTPVTVEHSLFVANEGPTGAVLDATDSDVVFADNTVVDAGDAIRTSGGTVVLENDLFAGATLAARVVGASDASRAGWNLFDAVDDEITGVASAGGDVHDAPGFADGWDATDCESTPWLDAGSPAVDAGSPDRPDEDGTVGDIGAFGVAPSDTGDAEEASVVLDLRGGRACGCDAGRAGATWLALATAALAIRRSGPSRRAAGCWPPSPSARRGPR